MRSALLVNAIKRLGVQGLGRSVFQQRSPYDESRVVFSLFFKTFSSAESASVENTEEPLKESRSKNLSKGLYWKVSDASRDSAESALEKWINDGKKLEKSDLQGLLRGLRYFGKYKKALEIQESLKHKQTKISQEEAYHTSRHQFYDRVERRPKIATLITNRINPWLLQSSRNNHEWMVSGVLVGVECCFP